MSIVTNPFDHILYEIEMYLYSYQPGLFSMPSQLMINLIYDSRAIHLRNLACFFSKARKSGCWWANDYVNDSSNIQFLDNALSRQINNYMSRATGHLLNYRLEETYKEDTKKCFQDAYPCIIAAIMSFFDTMDHNAKTEFRDYWKNKDICNRVEKVVMYIKSLDNSKKYVYEIATTSSCEPIVII